ncbi:uncharacterized protein MONBRDRAFT_38205 [Monosiga brevicollis MX1]|uniref:Uncharacterized protein n=1 Tax=Monosiga brevicollis TaxID=81824 RepID=A9V6A6_MONBE|nr:uncharacterized protein MONBRDRAFT_38205 [Monosiga brevicollis MX1]EDQ86957.1 predicted protein [Monosiga brevicollis MX1]|eukprot:XP_001748196.1 hypothetical protein [Monosiga brevicollis MX1]
MEKLVFNQAVSNGDIQRVAKLVNGDRTLLWEYLDSSGQTCFIRAILMAQREMLQALLEMAAEYAELCLSREDVTGKNAMHWAICVSDEEVVELLANVSPHLLVSKTSTNGDTVLHLLGREDNIEMLRFTSKLRSGLVEMRIMDINDSNKTPHEVAQDAGAVDTPAALLELFRKTIRPKETSLDARKRMQRTLAQRLYRVRFNKKTTGPGATSPDSVNGVSPDLKLDRLGVASSSSWAPAPGTLGLDSAQQYVSGKQAQYDFCDPFLSNPMEPEHLVLDEHLLDSATMAFEPSSSLRAGVLFSDEQLTAASHA